MPDILSQNQIDALLKGLNSGEMSVEEQKAASHQRKIKNYDFKSPKKFTKEQIKALDNLYENFARIISSYFTGMLRVYCEATVLQIEEQRFYEYNNALPDSALIGLIDVKTKSNSFDDMTMMTDMSTSLGFFMIDRLLGGSGKGHALNREFTDIEIAILGNVFEKIALFTQESWSSYLEVKASLSSIETNARMLQVYMPEDVVVIILMELKMKDLTGNFSICIPAINLEQMIGSFSSKYIRASKKTTESKEAARKQVIMNCLSNSDLEMKAVLHEIQLDLQDVLQIQTGDVIPLNKNIHSSISVMVENSPWFEAELGENKLKKVVKINHMI